MAYDDVTPTHAIRLGDDGFMEARSTEMMAALDGLGLEVLEECRTNLMMAMRFLDMALWRMQPEPRFMWQDLGSDGMHLFYNAQELTERYRKDPNEVIRDYLHTILHCIFHHPFEQSKEKPKLWSLACDICTEMVAIDLCGKRFPSLDDADRTKEFEVLKERLGTVTPPALYRALNDPADMTLFIGTIERRRLERLFTRDCHEMWRIYFRDGENAPTQTPDANDKDKIPGQEDDQKTANVPIGGDGEGSKSDDEENGGNSSGGDVSDEDDIDPDDGKDSDRDDNSQMLDEIADILEEDASVPQEADLDPEGEDVTESQEAKGESETPKDVEDAEESWTQISRSLEVDLESLSKSIGNGAGMVEDMLSIANRKPANYEDFLRQFSTMGEDMRLNDDEFDYIFYTYGLKLYGNMPLVEPLEYKEEERVREFVIALDTSASCSGALIKRFVERTYDVLGNSAGYGDEVNIHIIQCDDSIQSVTKISSPDELEDYKAHFQIKGYGGTDFRPVFQYVDDMLEKKEFRDLRGLIYFTDGQGKFPEAPPDYEAAFVFVEDGSGSVKVPPWAMRVVMNEEEIMQI